MPKTIFPKKLKKGDNLLKVSIDQGAMNALVSNGHLIIADGG